ncbi:Rhodanese-like domain-containing protein [Aspergillus foveolatus]|uniref:Rhodanese-like domain-containing protein n=1 Tax=Aspergillus foveolatus TaxID=210207 RepID=UPI003CCC97CA
MDEIRDRSSPYPQMLPSARQFAESMTKMGIHPDDILVVYDAFEVGLYSSPRVAWTCRHFGQRDVHVLNNFPRYMAEGLPLSTGPLPTLPPAALEYPINNPNSRELISYDELRGLLLSDRKSDVQVIDARIPGRFSGAEPEMNPALRSGHMPSALNVPLASILDKDKVILPAEELKARFQAAGVDGQLPVVLTCNSGVTAAALDLALQLSGYGMERRLQVASAARAVATHRGFATASPVAATARNHKVVVIGGGTAGLAISHQLLRSGRFVKDDIAIVDPAIWHNYQPGWTLVGGGLKTREQLRQPLAGLMDPKLKFYNESVGSFAPEENYITLGNSDKLNYDHLVVAPGITLNFGSVQGLSEALAAPDSNVSTIYSYDTCSKVFPTIEKLKKGQAIFTQPAGVIKCAGAPQKIMWLALDYWKKAGLYDPSNPAGSAIKIAFATGTPSMFGVPKYNAKLEELRKERGVEGLFQHDLVAIDGKKATFARPNGESSVTREFDLLHVVPKMGPHAFVKNSALANEAGYVDVDDGTTRHKKFANVWSAGDASSLPTSKTAAAITAEAPVLVQNLLRSMDGKELDATYDGYTSCPLTTEYGKVLLAEFKYGGVPKETFGKWFGIDQGTPRKEFYFLKKHFFPWVYYESMVSGKWGGPKGWL